MSITLMGLHHPMANGFCCEIVFKKDASHVLKRLKKTQWTVWYGMVERMVLSWEGGVVLSP